MGNKDWMWLKISMVDRAEVFVNKGKNYVYEGRPSTAATLGKKFAMLKGKDYYVSGWSDSMLIGFFRLETWVELFNPLPEQEEDQNLLPYEPSIRDETTEEDASVFEDEEEYTKSKKEMMKEYYDEQSDPDSSTSDDTPVQPSQEQP